MKLLKIIIDSVSEWYSEMVNTDVETVRQIFKTDLHMTKVCTRMVPHILTLYQKVNLTSCSMLL